MLVLVSLFSCVQSPTVTEAEPVAEGPAHAMAAPADLPAGKAIVRIDDCFGVQREEEMSAGMAPPPSPPQSGPAGYGSGGGSRPSSSSKSGSSGSGRATADSAAMPEPAPMVEAEPSRRDSKPAPAPKEKAQPATEAPMDDAADVASGPRGEANLDWGAVVHLSNDDSMSLASAQRVLWAVQNDAAVDTAQVRPHELLNYFSFDTDPVKSGLFSVRGSAEKTADETLTVAFAVKGATPEPKPLDLTLVIDRSGSMRAEGRMDYVKKGLTVAKGNLKRGDRVDVVLFDDRMCTPLENYVHGRDDASLLDEVIARLEPRGGTNIGIGLKEGYRIATASERNQGVRRNRRVMLLTDALVNQGYVDPDVLSEVGKAFDQQGVRLTGVGVGRDFNDKVLDKLTEKGKGAYVYLGSEAVVNRVFGQMWPSLTQTIAHDVRFSVDLPDSLAMERFYGEEASTNPDDVQPINYYAGTSQLFLQDLRVKPSDLKPSDPIVLTISYREASTGEPAKQTFKMTVGDLMGTDRHNLDKGRALMAWTDMVLARSMGGEPCGAPLDTYRERAGKVADDAEIAYVNSLVKKWCPVDLPTAPVAKAGVSYKVKVDSDVPIAEVVLACGGAEHKQSLTGSDTVARFEAVPGQCSLTLQGGVPMQTAVTVPETGGDVRCLVRGGRLSCS